MGSSGAPSSGDPATVSMMGIKWRKPYLLLLGVLGLVMVVYLVNSHSSQSQWKNRIDETWSKSLNSLNDVWSNRGDNKEGGPATYDVWDTFQAEPGMKLSYFKLRCANQQDYSLAGLIAIQKDWALSRDTLCRDLYKKFHAVFTMDLKFATVRIPEPFQAKVRRWLGNNELLFQEVYNQSTINIINHYQREHTIFNPIRDKRPVSKPDVPEQQYFDDIIAETEKTCDFCKYKNYTAMDDFGRVESQYSFSASNIFKLGPRHAIIAPKSHNPLDVDLPRYLDLMRLTNKWVEASHKMHPSARYPAFIWDVLPKCGASQVHPHVQALLDTDRYPGVQEAWRTGAQDYFTAFRSNYYTDLATMYSVLNLTASYGKAVAFASLVPKKDHEVVIMAEEASDDFFKLVYFVLRGFTDDLGKMCYSMGLAYPAVEVPEGRIPAYARVITRGTISEIRSDISSFELWEASNVNIDPYKTIQIVRNSIQKRRNIL